MTKRIGLFTPVSRQKKGAASTVVSYVEINAAADLAEKLSALGAKRVGLLCKDRAGTTRLEGEMFTVADLKDEHVDWAMSKPAEFQTRGIFYDQG